MNNFEERYRQLNPAQKKAVDTIDGPLMVVAGPGTGKTELLSVRVANILRKTDALPQNILCLTFTESGASAMRERLSGLIGADAYKVAIHTFHSFGSEIINQYGDYFYHGAHFRPADELSTYEILNPILEKLPHDSPIASKMNGAFTHLSDIKSTISNLKKSGLTPDEAGQILDRNDAFSEWLQPRLQAAFGPRLSKKSFDAIESLVYEINSYDEKPLDLVGYHPLYKLISDSLSQVLDEARIEDSTKPLSAWKREYLEKDAHGEQCLKDLRRSKKIRATLGVYFDYLLAMQERSLYDFDDMILRVVHAMEVFAELRFNLQEQYQYILVDEFQDTNDAQMRIIWNLTNNEASAGRPNLMVVGDDDQAIYRFQGANISNILDFSQNYRDAAIVTLKDNYRSSSPILDAARQVIVQGEDRLENIMESVDKTLRPHSTAKDNVSLTSYPNEADEYYAVADRIRKSCIQEKSKTRAIIARHHRQLAAVLPYLQEAGLAITYERQESVLDSEPITQLELLARIVDALARQQPDDANELMPKLLAHPAWGIDPITLWRISLDAHKARKSWLETMLAGDEKLQDIASWIITSAMLAQNETLEYMLDRLFGSNEAQANETAQTESEEPFDDPGHEQFTSPLKAYFFQHDGLDRTPGTFISHLQAMQKLRQVVRDYRPDTRLSLRDFVHCLDLYEELGISIEGKGSVLEEENSVALLTAHKSKGLEYDEVYIIDAVDAVWGNTSRSRGSLISFPSNMPLAPAGDSSDERLRLLYVAMTRAKQRMELFVADQNISGSPQLVAGPLVEVVEKHEITHTDPAHVIESLLHDWRQPLYNVAHATAEQLLRPELDRYKLSATHFNNFLDVSRGGPELFLLHNLLRFPQAMSPHAAYGSAVHTSLQRAHAHFAATGKKRPVEDVLHDFETALSAYQLATDDELKFQSKGGDILTQFLAKRYDSFTTTQVVERNFAGEAIKCGDARLAGAIDLMDIDDTSKTIVVTDYKTGKAVLSWKGRTDFEKIKLHHYKQQLMMYKYLIENSRQFEGYTVSTGIIEFVEPDERGEIVRLEYECTTEDMERFKTLLSAVWKRIMALDFALPETYETSYKGIIAFEDFLVEE